MRSLAKALVALRKASLFGLKISFTLLLCKMGFARAFLEWRLLIATDNGNWDVYAGQPGYELTNQKQSSFKIKIIAIN